ncbi:S9 family peptidase, partial [bacterium]
PDEPEAFKTLFAYSPYHHVEAGKAYPPLLLMSTDSDDRVDPLHARKFAAAMQAASPGTETLLRIEKNAGHGGADQRKAGIQEDADQLGFFHARLAK